MLGCDGDRDGRCCRERGHKFEPWAQLEADIGGHVVAANAPGMGSARLQRVWVVL